MCRKPKGTWSNVKSMEKKRIVTFFESGRTNFCLASNFTKAKEACEACVQLIINNKHHGQSTMQISNETVFCTKFATVVGIASCLWAPYCFGSPPTVKYKCGGAFFFEHLGRTQVWFTSSIQYESIDWDWCENCGMCVVTQVLWCRFNRSPVHFAKGQVKFISITFLYH